MDSKAGICIMYPCGFINAEEMVTIDPAHTSYIDFSLGKAEYKLVAVYGPSGPKCQGDNETFFSYKIFDERIFNTKKHLIAVGDWNVGIFPHFDYHNYSDENNYRTESRDQIIAGNEEFNLTDIFRERQPDPDKTC